MTQRKLPSYGVRVLWREEQGAQGIPRGWGRDWSIQVATSSGGTHKVNQHPFVLGLDWVVLLRHKPESMPQLQAKADTATLTVHGDPEWAPWPRARGFCQGTPNPTSSSPELPSMCPAQVC